MAERTFTEAEVGRILSAALERFVTEADRPKVYPLSEVAEMTLLGERWLLDECRTGRAQHVQRGGRRGMTAAQIWALIDRHSEGGDPATVAPTTLSAVQMSRRNAARTRRRTA